MQLFQKMAMRYAQRRFHEGYQKQLKKNNVQDAKEQFCCAIPHLEGTARCHCT